MEVSARETSRGEGGGDLIILEVRWVNGIGIHVALIWILDAGRSASPLRVD